MTSLLRDRGSGPVPPLSTICVGPDVPEPPVPRVHPSVPSSVRSDLGQELPVSPKSSDLPYRKVFLSSHTRFQTLVRAPFHMGEGILQTGRDLVSRLRKESYRSPTPHFVYRSPTPTAPSAWESGLGSLWFTRVCPVSDSGTVVDEPLELSSQLLSKHRLKDDRNGPLRVRTGKGVESLEVLMSE